MEQAGPRLFALEVDVHPRLEQVEEGADVTMATCLHGLALGGHGAAGVDGNAWPPLKGEGRQTHILGKISPQKPAKMVLNLICSVYTWCPIASEHSFN